jgi:hypothetical protein
VIKIGPGPELLQTNLEESEKDRAWIGALTRNLKVLAYVQICNGFRTSS